MAQRAVSRTWPIIRRVLFDLGGVALLALLVHMVVFVVTRSSDAREKLYLSVLDKLLLGVAAAGVGFWLQQRLELFKRDQSLASELAKARIAAYNKVLSAVTALEFHVRRLVSKMFEMKELRRRGQEEVEVAERDLSAAQERIPIATTEEEEAWERHVPARKARRGARVVPPPHPARGKGQPTRWVFSASPDPAA
jgi:hypothetical protein